MKKIFSLAVALLASLAVQADNVAKIGTTEYETLAAAVVAVPTDGTETTITMIADDYYDVNNAISVAKGQKIVLDLNGKTISQDVPDAAASTLINVNGTLTITDGTDAGNDGVDCGQIVLKSCSYSASASYGNYAINVSGTLTLNSGLIKCTAAGGAVYALNTINGGNFTMNGGKLYNTSSTAFRMFATSAATTVINGGTIEGSYAGMQVMFGKNVVANVIINGGTLKSGSYGFYDYAASNAAGKCKYEINGGTIDAPYSIFTYGADLTINDGHFIGAVYLNYKYASFDCAINGGYFDDFIYAYDTAYAPEAFIHGGYHGDPDCYWYYYMADETKYIENTDPETKDKYPYVLIPCKAKIDSEYYLTLAEAIEAVQTGETVTILRDIACGEFESTGINIATGKDFTLDLAGHTISGTGVNANKSRLILVNKNASLVINDSSAEGTGKITYSSTHPDPSWGYGTNTILNDGGNLTVNGGRIENLTVNGASYAIDNSSNIGNASLTLNGGTITCPNGDQAVRQFCNSATLTNNVVVNEGTVIEAGGMWLQMPSGMADRKGTLTINGGTINGMIDLMSNNIESANVTINGGTFDITKLRIRNGAATEPFITINGGNFSIAAVDNQEPNIKALALAGGHYNIDLTQSVAVVDNYYTLVTGTDATYPYYVKPMTLGYYRENGVESEIGGNTINLNHNLADNLEVYADADYPTVNYTRKFSNDVLQTWCLPCDITITEDIIENFTFGKIWSVLVDKETGAATDVVYKTIKAENFSSLSDKDKVLKANTPYLVQCHAPGTYVFTGHGIKQTANTTIDCSTTELRYNFVGNYATTRMGDVEAYTLTKDGELKYSETGNGKVYPFNWYMNITDRTTGTLVPAGSLGTATRLQLTPWNEDEDYTTGIYTVGTKESVNLNNGSFDLSGRMTSKAGKGLYIMNGKKVLVK